MTNIVCLKWGVKYGPDYVNKLFASIKRNTTVDFKFHCFTEDPVGLHPDIIAHDLPYAHLDGWWNKVYLFSSEIDIPIGETIFYLDLDSLITDNIDKFLRHRSTIITVLRDFYWGLAQTAGQVGSGLMSWEHGKYTFIWDQFIADPAGAMESVSPFGDQHYIALLVKVRHYWQELFPNEVVSFKVHCRLGLPKDAAIVCYHGVPSIPGSATTKGKSWKFYWKPSPWVLNYWRE